MPKKTTKKSENTEPAGAPKVFDVAKPGETAADATARPVIVGHGTMIKQDPMVVDKDPPKSSKKVSKTGVSIQPLTDIDETNSDDEIPAKQPTTIKVLDEKIEKPEETKSEESTETSEPEVEGAEVATDAKESEPVSKKSEPEVDEPDQPTEATTEEKEPQEPAESDEAEQPESSEAAATNAIANELVAKKAEEEKAKEAAKKADEVQALVDSKKYFVSVHQGATSGGAGKWILLLLLLLIVGAVLAVDAGLVDVGITLPFDLIKN